MSLASNRIVSHFKTLKDEGRKAFVPYICAGDPNLEATIELVCALDRAGADVVELGIPFTDPMADGPANQAACERALAAGTTMAGIMEAVKAIRERTQIPLLYFTYLNPVVAYGLDKFCADAVAAGVDGVLLLDLPPEEDVAMLETFRAAGLATVCLSAPNTMTERKVQLAKESRGFLYYVSRLGITGERETLPEDLGEQVAKLQAAGDASVCIGFGIKSPEQAAEAASVGDGVVIGSHLVRIIEAKGADDDLVSALESRATELAAAVHGAGTAP